MTAVTSTLRADLAAQAQTILLASGLVDDVFEVVPGMLNGPVTDKDRGSVWVEQIEPSDQTARLRIVELHLRVFKRQYVSRGGDLKPLDPSVLEELAEQVQASFNGLATSAPTLGGTYWVEHVQFLIEQQGIEVTIATRVPNVFV